MEEQSVRLFLNPSQKQNLQQQQLIARRKILRRLNSNSNHQQDRAEVSLERTQSTHKSNNIYHTNSNNQGSIIATIQPEQYQQGQYYSQSQKTKSCSNHVKLADKQFASLESGQQHKQSSLYDPEYISPFNYSSSNSRGRRLLYPASVGNTRSNSRSTTNTSSRPPSQIRTARRLVVRDEQANATISTEEQIQVPLKNELISLLSYNTNVVNIENQLNSSDQCYLNKIKVATKNRPKKLLISTTPLRMVVNNEENEIQFQQISKNRRQNNTNSMNLELEDLKRIQLLGGDFLDQPISQTLDISNSTIKSSGDSRSRRYKRSGIFWKPRLPIRNNDDIEEDSKQLQNLTICSTQQESQQLQVIQVEDSQHFELRQSLKDKDHQAGLIRSENDQQLNNQDCIINKQFNSKALEESALPFKDQVSEEKDMEKRLEVHQSVTNHLETASLVSQGQQQKVERDIKMNIKYDQEGGNTRLQQHKKLRECDQDDCKDNRVNKEIKDNSCNKLIQLDYSVNNGEDQYNQVSSVFPIISQSKSTLLDIEEQRVTQLALPQQPQKISQAASLSVVSQSYLLSSAFQASKCNINKQTLSNEMTLKVISQNEFMIDKDDDVGQQHSILNQKSQSIVKNNVKEQQKDEKMDQQCELLGFPTKKVNESIKDIKDVLQKKVDSIYIDNSFDESSCSSEDDAIVVTKEEEKREIIRKEISLKNINDEKIDVNYQQQVDDCLNNYKENITKNQEQEADKNEDSQSIISEDSIEGSYQPFELPSQTPLNTAGQITTSKSRVRDVFNDEFWNPVAFPKNYAITSNKSTQQKTQQINIIKNTTIQSNKENNNGTVSSSNKNKLNIIKRRSQSSANQQLKPTEPYRANTNNISRNYIYNYYTGETQSQLFDEVNDKCFWQQQTYVQSNKVNNYKNQQIQEGKEERLKINIPNYDLMRIRVQQEETRDIQQQPFQQINNNCQKQEQDEADSNQKKSEISQQNYEDWDAELELIS